MARTPLLAKKPHFRIECLLPTHELTQREHASHFRLVHSDTPDEPIGDADTLLDAQAVLSCFAYKGLIIEQGEKPKLIGALAPVR